MNRDQYIAIIKARLGGQLLDIELTGEQIGELVDIAFMELNPYIDTPYFKTLPANSCIDLSNENVRAILYVVRAKCQFLFFLCFWLFSELILERSPNGIKSPK